MSHTKSTIEFMEKRRAIFFYHHTITIEKRENTKTFKKKMKWGNNKTKNIFVVVIKQVC